MPVDTTQNYLKVLGVGLPFDDPFWQIPFDEPMESFPYTWTTNTCEPYTPARKYEFYDEDNYKIFYVEIPGFGREDVEVEIDSGDIDIILLGESKEYLSYPIPDVWDLCLDTCRASVSNGILTIVFARKNNVKKLEVV